MDGNRIVKKLIKFQYTRHCECFARAKVGSNLTLKLIRFFQFFTTTKNICDYEIIGLIILVLLVFPSISFSQNKEEAKNSIIENRIEYLIDNVEESDVDYTTLFTQLDYYFEHPLNLNRAELADLEELGLLSAIQINNLLEHIEKNGKLRKTCLISDRSD